MSGRLFDIYSSLPIWMQNAACSLAGLRVRARRYNRTFYEFLAAIEESQWWSFADLREYQNERLREVIRHAWESVPYYREVMDARKLTPDDIKTVDDLPKLPLLTKDIVRQRYADLLSRNWPKRRMERDYTSGTTGTALRFYRDIDLQSRLWAVWWRHRRRSGIELHSPFVVFAGRDVVPRTTMKPPFWRRNWPLHQTYVSTHHMTFDNMPILAEYLQSRSVEYYVGFPSGLCLLADYFVKHDIRLHHPIKAVVSGAETLMTPQRELISKAFGGVPVTDQYGLSEQCCDISQCEQGTYHVDMEFGAVEFMDVEGVQSGEKCIVATGFWNFPFPFIRYETGDLATPSDSPCGCGRHLTAVTKINGRRESYIVTPDGRRLGRLDYIFKKTYRIKEAQLVQDNISSVVIKVVKDDGYGPSDEKMLLDTARDYLGDEIEVLIEYTDAIARNEGGKFRYVISTVDATSGAAAQQQEGLLNETGFAESPQR